MDEALRHTQADWDRFFYALAEQSARMSKDPDRKVGAIVASTDRRQVSIGYNGFPSDIPDTPEHLHNKEFKLAHTVHAEHNCLQQAPFDVSGGSLYVTRFPCRDCAGQIILKGIKRVVAPIFDPMHMRWGPSWLLSARDMSLAGIEIVFVEDLK